MVARKQVLVPIAVGTEAMEAVIVIGVLRKAGADVTVATVGDELCVDNSVMYGVTMVADAPISACADTVFDLISVPGGMLGASNLGQSRTFWRMLCTHVEQGRLYGATGAASAALLGIWGLLWKLKATTNPSSMEMLSSYAIPVDSPVQLDGKAVTSQGLGTTMEYALTLVDQLFGTDKAHEVSRLLFLPFGPNGTFIAAELNKSCAFRPQVLLPIADGSEELEVVMMIAVLRRAKADIVLASVGEKLEIMGSNKVRLVADTLLSDAAKLSYDLIMLPGGFGGAQAFANSEALVSLLKNHIECGKYYGALCPSSILVLEPHGLLKGESATIWDGLLDPKNRVVADGNLLSSSSSSSSSSSRALGTSFGFTLAIVEELSGREKALEIAKRLLLM